jgi:N-acetylmuramoyl-L-alanine amidase
MLSDLLLGLSLMYGSMSDGQLNCLATNIYHEARNETYEGQLAVTHVVFNRTHSNKFPSTYCDVIYQGVHWQGHPIRNQCQFSWYCDGLSDTPRDMRAWRKSVQAARDAWTSYYMSGVDVTNGADHYHANYVMPYWSKEMMPTNTIGNHIFYKAK